MRWSHGFFKLDVSYQDITFFQPDIFGGKWKAVKWNVCNNKYNIHDFMHDSLKQQVKKGEKSVADLASYLHTPKMFK